MIWTNNKFIGYWPVGTAAVVRAETRERAAEILNDKLQAMKLQTSARPGDFDELPEGECVVILCDGNY